MIELAPYFKVGCYDLACDGTGCGPCGVEVNAWMPFLFQQHAECEIDCPDGAPPMIPGVNSRDLSHCVCAATRPLLPGCTPADPIHPNQIAQGAGAHFAWWYEAARHDLTIEALGFVVHRLTLGEPRAFSAAQNEALRARIPLLDGLLIGEGIIEAVGATRWSTQLLADLIKSRLETAVACEQYMDVWLGCVCDDTKPSLRRRLTGVGEFHVTPIEGTTMSETGSLFSVVWSADTLVEFIDEETPEVEATLIGTSVVSCPSSTTTADFTELTPRTICNADIVLQTDGSLKLCPADYETFDLASCYLQPRKLSVVDASSIEGCPLQVDLDLTVSPPIMTPLQPTLFQTQVLDKIGTIGTYSATENPIIVKTLTVANSDYNPDCPTCPIGIRARECAVQAGLVVNAAGVIDWTASGINPTTWYTWTSGGGSGSAALTKILNFYQCLGWTGTSPLAGGGTQTHALWNPAAIFDHMLSINGGLPGPPSPPVSLKYRIDNIDVPTIRAERADGQVTNTSFIVTSETFPGYDATDPITAEGEEGSCGDAPSHCLPTFKGTPTGKGPCVEITIASNGTVVSSVNPTTDDLLDAQFSFGPAFQAAGNPDCPGIIPPKPQLSVNTASGLVSPIGWTVGHEWPAESTAAQYEIVTVNGSANQATPVASTVQREVITTSTSCPSPVQLGSQFAPEALSSSWTDITSAQSVYLATVSGLSKNRTYRPVWEITAQGDVDQPQVYLWAGDSATPAPTPATVNTFVCDADLAPVRVLALASTDTIRHDSRGLRVDCSTGSVDAFAGWIDAADPWASPEICGAETVHMIVVSPNAGVQPPKIKLVPVSTP